MTCTMGFYVRYVAFVLNLLSRTWIGLPSPYLLSLGKLPAGACGIAQFWTDVTC